MAAIAQAAGMDGMSLLMEEDPIYLLAAQAVSRRAHAIGRKIDQARASYIAADLAKVLG